MMSYACSFFPLIYFHKTGTLAQALRNGAQILGGQVQHREDCTPRNIAYISLRASDAKLAEQARRVQELGTWDRLTHKDLNVDRLIDPKAMEENQHLLHLGIGDLLNRHVLELSTGQLRKLCIAKELLKKPRICIFDEPFDGLDADSRHSLAQLLAQPGPTQTILISHRINEINEVPGITHILEIGDDNQVHRMGPKDQVFGDHILQHLDHSSRTGGKFDASKLSQEVSRLMNASSNIAKTAEGQLQPKPTTLIDMSNVQVKFGDTVILKDLSWVVKPGQHWSIEGPNGSGVS